MSARGKPALWLRDEEKPGERRTLLPPGAARALVEAGYPLVVERSANRAFPIEDYAALGARIEPSGAWRDAPPETIVLGLKELDPGSGPFAHRHVHFAHAFKYQRGWRDAIAAFDAGGGALYDLEYLVDERGRRVAAFGRDAGFVGAALGLLVLADALPAPLDAWPDRAALVRAVRDALAARAGAFPGGPSRDGSLPDDPPRALVIGARGRSGRGAVEACEAAGVAVTAWDVDETAAGGPFDAVPEHDLLVSCVFVDAPVAPFTTLDALRAAPARRLRAIVDVGCDPFGGDSNPLPVYGAPTTLASPTLRLLEGADASPPVDLVAIDHLPSLLPREASEDFAAQLLGCLLALDRLDEGAWARARSVYDARLAEVREGGPT